MVDLGNPLYFCEWLKRYLDEGGYDLSMIAQMVEIPLKCKRGMNDSHSNKEERQQSSCWGLIADIMFDSKAGEGYD